jgi:hypothetical protein
MLGYKYLRKLQQITLFVKWFKVVVPLNKWFGQSSFVFFLKFNYK